MNWLDRFATAFAGTDANAIFQGEDEDFAISYIARLSPSNYGVYSGLDELLIYSYLEPHLFKHIARLFPSPVDLSATLLASASKCVRDSPEVALFFVEL